MTPDTDDLKKMLAKLDRTAGETLDVAQPHDMVEQAINDKAFLAHALKIAMSEAPAMSDETAAGFEMGFFAGWRFGLQQAIFMMQGMASEVKKP
jgi:hypothetical protein